MAPKREACSTETRATPGNTYTNIVAQVNTRWQPSYLFLNQLNVWGVLLGFGSHVAHSQPHEQREHGGTHGNASDDLQQSPTNSRTAHKQ